VVGTVVFVLLLLLLLQAMASAAAVSMMPVKNTGDRLPWIIFNPLLSVQG
jgi:hypothetical protein